MKRLAVCFLAGMTLCGPAFANLDSDKADSGFKFKESAGKSGFSVPQANSGSGGVYTGGTSFARPARRKNYGKSVVRSEAGKSLAAKVPPPEMQKPHTGQATVAASGKSAAFPSVAQIAPKAAQKAGRLVSTAIKAAASPAGKKIALAALGAAIAGLGTLALMGGAASGVGVGAAIKAGAVIAAKTAWSVKVAVTSSKAYVAVTSSPAFKAYIAATSSLPFQALITYFDGIEEAH